MVAWYLGLNVDEKGNGEGDAIGNEDGSVKGSGAQQGRARFGRDYLDGVDRESDW